MISHSLVEKLFCGCLLLVAVGCGSMSEVGSGGAVSSYHPLVVVRSGGRSWCVVVVVGGWGGGI